MARTKVMAAALATAGVILAVVGWAAPSGFARVRSGEEAFRDQPDGARLGSLLQGTQVDRIEQDGAWVRVRMEGWVRADALESPAAQTGGATAAEPASALPLHEATPRLRRLVNEEYGTFYRVEHDAELGRLTLRLRVAPTAPEELRRKQRRIQGELLQMLGDEVGCTQVRIESNRADGSGRVGVEIAETGVAHLRQLAPADTAGWRRATRISHDAGVTWEP
jgi:hypothetical protein